MRADNGSLQAPITSEPKGATAPRGRVVLSENCSVSVKGLSEPVSGGKSRNLSGTADVQDINTRLKVIFGTGAFFYRPHEKECQK